MSVVSPPSSEPPVKLKMRGDLTFDRQNYQGVEYWVVKEPVGQKFYQFPPNVVYLLKLLDGTRSVEQIIDSYHETHAPKRITRNDLQQLLMRFHKDGLVISDASGQGSELLRRGRKSIAMERVTSLSNILAVRYRGFDPEMILNWVIKWTWWLFTPAAVIFFMFAGAIALTSVVVNWAEFQARLPGFDAFFDVRRWYMFAAVLCFSKVLHEFGHGLSCKRLGGECHEIGFMLLVLTPCLYCNVSDSWRLPNKWHRAAIGAAGMYIEVILATIATFVWWFAEPGIVQDICLQFMLISSISTVLFNGNPLLRFDGYYIMSDVLEIPNLQQKSSKALTTLLGRHWLGLEIPDDQLMPTNRPLAFAMFTIAAFCYRWFIMFSILLFLTRWLEPYGLDSLGRGIAAFSIFGMLLWPLYRLYKYMSVPGRMHQVKKKRFSIISIVLLVVLGCLLFIPLPHQILAPVVVVPKSFETVYVQETGLLRDPLIQPGDMVEAGDVLAELENIDLAMALSEAQSELEQKRSERQIALKAGTAGGGGEYFDMLDSIDSDIVDAQKKINDLQRRVETLKLTSKISGRVLATPYQATASDEAVIDPQPLLTGGNESVTAVQGQRFCEVADFSKWYAIVLLTENQLEFAHEGQGVRIKLYAEPGRVIESKIIEEIGVSDRTIGKSDRYEPVEESMRRMELPDIVSEMVAQQGQEGIQYFARVEIEKGELPFKIGYGGQARLQTRKRSLAERVMFWLNENFGS
jgi:putative peptide zinc metalloprotease protein